MIESEEMKVKEEIEIKEEKKESDVNDFIDTSTRGGDEDMLEGTEIKDTNKFDENWNDSSSEVHLSFLSLFYLIFCYLHPPPNFIFLGRRF